MRRGASGPSVEVEVLGFALLEPEVLAVGRVLEEVGRLLEQVLVALVVVVARAGLDGLAGKLVELERLGLLGRGREPRGRRARARRRARRAGSPARPSRARRASGRRPRAPPRATSTSGAGMVDGVLEVRVLLASPLGRRLELLLEVDLAEVGVLDVEDRALGRLRDRLLDRLRLGGGRRGLRGDRRRVLAAAPSRRLAGVRGGLELGRAPAPRRSRTRDRRAARRGRTPPARAGRAPNWPRRAGASARGARGSRRRGFPWT